MFILDSKRGKYTPIGDAPDGMIERLDKGVYNLVATESPPQLYFTRNNDYKDGIKLNHGVFKKVRDFFDDFFSNSKYKAREALNMKHKLGIIFSGDPGTGKTFLAGQLGEEIAEKYDAVAILTTKYTDYSDLIDTIRINDKDRFIVLIVDEMEKTFRDYYTDALSFYSGAKERNNLIIINTVNDSSRLPSFIKDRPSRIEEEFNFSFDDEDVLRSVVENMIPIEYKDSINIIELIDKIKKYRNKSIDRIKHIIRDIIAISIDLKTTGIKKEVIIKDSLNELSRTTVSGFSKQEEPLELSEICIDSPFQKFEWAGLDTTLKELSAIN